MIRREDDYFVGRVDNPLYESRLHEIHKDAEIYFHADHVLALHPLHREEVVCQMEPGDLRTLVEWLGTQRGE